MAAPCPFSPPSDGGGRFNSDNHVRDGGGEGLAKFDIWRRSDTDMAAGKTGFPFKMTELFIYFKRRSSSLYVLLKKIVIYILP